MLSKRSNKPERLDDPQMPPEVAAEEYAMMCGVNRLMGGVKAVKSYLWREFGRRRDQVRILDIGSGSCDIPIAICQWASRVGMEVRFTCLDIHPVALRMAREQLLLHRERRIELLKQDVFGYTPKRAFDCAIGSMFFHNLDDAQILYLLRHVRKIVQQSVLINDIRRCWWMYAGCQLITLGMFRSSRPDAIKSVAKGFKAHELRVLLAGLDDVRIEVSRAYLGRITAVLRFD